MTRWQKCSQRTRRAKKENPPCGGFESSKMDPGFRAARGPGMTLCRRGALRAESHWIPERRFAASGMMHRQRRALGARAIASLDLAFLVEHVLADDGVVFLDLHLVRRVLFVLFCG